MDKKAEPFHIVLVEPEIPGNTGNISRLCAATGCHLHLVRPLGFTIDDKTLKRAGLDYWHLLTVSYHDNFVELQQLYPTGRFFCHTTKTDKFHSAVAFQPGDFLVFGKETAGLPATILNQYPDRCVRLPMIEGARSLNLSNAVAVSVYEALRQTGYGGLR
jgi:tRNA (cytidine/uridine-2'-O-)-methyltransferase